MAIGFDINPIQPVAAQIKPPQGMSLADMVNMASGIQAYKQAQQMNPLLLEQQRSMTGTAEEQRKQAVIGTAEKQFGLDQKQFDALMREQVALINDRDVIAAEQDPSMVNLDDLTAKVVTRGMTKAKNLRIPEDRARELLEPYVQQIKNNPAGLRDFLKQRHIAALDDAARTGAFQPSGPMIDYTSGGVGVQTNIFGPGAVGSEIPGTRFVRGLPPTRDLYIKTLDSSGNEVLAPVNQQGQIIGRPGPPGEVGAGQAAPRGGIVGQPPQGAVPPTAPAAPNAPVGTPTAQTGTTVGGAPRGLRSQTGYKYTVFPSGQSRESMRDLQTLLNKTAADARNARDLGYYSDEILRLANETPTGTGADLIQKIASVPGINRLVSTGSNLAELEKFLSASTVSTADDLGMSGSDAKVAMVGAMTGTKSTPTDALKAVTRTNRAMRGTGLSYFNQGVNAAIKNAEADPNYKYPSIFVMRDMQNAFANIDPRAILYASFKDYNDAEGAALLKESLGLNSPTESAREAGKQRWAKIYSDYNKLLQLKQGIIDGR